MNVKQYDNAELDIINYRLLSTYRKKNLVKDLNKIGFPSNDYKHLLNHFNQSIKDCLPQYYFIYHKNRLIGYCFLIGEEPNDYFIWWITHNLDTIDSDNASYLFNYFILECERLNWTKGIKFFKEEIVDCPAFQKAIDECL